MGQRAEETPKEKGHRQLTELLQELRVALPGIQVLFAFLLIVPFSAGWDRISDFQQDLYYGCLLASAAASACFIAPTALHRIDFEQGDKPNIIRLSHYLAIAGLSFLMLAMVGVVWLITDVLYSGAKVVGFTVGTALFFMALWWVVPLFMRLRDRG